MTRYKRHWSNYQVLFIVLLFAARAWAGTIETIVENAKGQKKFQPQLDEITKIGLTAMPELTSIFKNNKMDFQSRCFALEAIRILDSQEALSLMIKYAEDPAPTIRSSIAQKLSHYSDQESGSLLKKYLRDSSLLVRSASVESIHQRQDHFMVESLLEALLDSQNIYRNKKLWIHKVNLFIIKKKRKCKKRSKIIKLKSNLLKSKIKF